MDNVVRGVYLRTLNISVNGKTIVEKEDIDRNIREVRLYNFVYQMLVENTDSDWEYQRHNDMFAGGIQRTYQFYNHQGDMAVVTIFFVPNY